MEISLLIFKRVVAKCRILDVDISWPGSVHDARILLNSNIKTRIENGELNGILLGDSGYRLLPYLMTSYFNPITPAQLLFNKSHKATRVRVEMAFGQLQQRFALLHFGLRLSLERCSAAILTACILHNLSKKFSDPQPEDNKFVEWNDGEQFED